MQYRRFLIGLGISSLLGLGATAYPQSASAMPQMISDYLNSGILNLGQNLGEPMAQNSSYQENSISISSKETNSASLSIEGQGAKNVNLQVRLNGKLVKSISNGDRVVISLKNCLAGRSCTVDISGSYGPENSEIITEISTPSTTSQQTSGGNGTVSQRINLSVN
ncbi:MAG: hypothetical protein WCO45_06285 [Pseudanabaena sp. ELA607]